jgi:hypothetical protein
MVEEITRYIVKVKVDHGFKPGPKPSDISGRKQKILSTPSFRGGVKAVLSHVADLRHVKEP